MLGKFFHFDKIFPLQVRFAKNANEIKFQPDQHALSN